MPPSPCPCRVMLTCHLTMLTFLAIMPYHPPRPHHPAVLAHHLISPLSSAPTLPLPPPTFPPFLPAMCLLSLTFHPFMPAFHQAPTIICHFLVTFRPFTASFCHVFLEQRGLLLSSCHRKQTFQRSIKRHHMIGLSTRISRNSSLINIGQYINHIVVRIACVITSRFACCFAQAGL